MSQFLLDHSPDTRNNISFSISHHQWVQLAGNLSRIKNKKEKKTKKKSKNNEDEDEEIVVNEDVVMKDSEKSDKQPQKRSVHLSKHKK